MVAKRSCPWRLRRNVALSNARLLVNGSRPSASSRRTSVPVRTGICGGTLPFGGPPPFGGGPPFGGALPFRGPLPFGGGPGGSCIPAVELRDIQEGSPLGCDCSPGGDGLRRYVDARCL